MRLLNTLTIRTKEFFDDEIPPYAILSHTWGDNELSFQDLQTSGQLNPTKANHQKVLKCCEQAALDGFKYVWMDTCCIDRTNSAELSEAINSMFRWYRDAVVCYAYLKDVYCPDGYSKYGSYYPEDFMDQFEVCRWFKRGWTLQELIAPTSLRFFDRQWTEIGTKASLKDEIAPITGIPPRVLVDDEPVISQWSIAQIMSWASDRETKRVEDRAYCLIGLFEVNMSLMYGEGEKAFIRLQHEILKHSSDQSIFAWTGPIRDFSEEDSLFAVSPARFGGSGTIKRRSEPYEYSLTNRGLRIDLPLAPIGSYDINPALALNVSVVGVLACEWQDGTRVGIALRNDPKTGNYYRINHLGLLQISSSKDLEEVVRQLYINATRGVPRRSRRDDLRVRKYNISGPSNISLVNSKEHHGYQRHHTESGLSMTDKVGYEGFLFLHRRSRSKFAVIVGVIGDKVWLDVETEIGNEELESVVESYRNPQLQGAVHEKRRQATVERLDRNTKIIGRGTEVSVAVNKEFVEGSVGLTLNIKVSE